MQSIHRDKDAYASGEAEGAWNYRFPIEDIEWPKGAHLPDEAYTILGRNLVHSSPEDYANTDEWDEAWDQAISNELAFQPGIRLVEIGLFGPDEEE